MQLTPKPGRLATGAYVEASPIKGSVFGSRPRDNAFYNPGGLFMPQDRTQTDYTSPISDFHNTATNREVVALTRKGDQSHTLVRPTGHGTVEIGPYERGTFMKANITPINKTQFGADKNSRSDTAFHPAPPKHLPRVVPQSEIQGERTKADSWRSHGNQWNDKNNSFYNKAPSVTNPGTHGKGRWQTVKKGAAG